MIESNEIFLEYDPKIALWCDGVWDTNDLANLANYILESKIDLISVSSNIVYYMWTCLEKNKVKIFTRYNFAPLQKNMDKDVFELAENITGVWKRGAMGAQIFLKMRDFERFIDTFMPVRDDLFFEHDLCIGLDISEIGISDWDFLFQQIRSIRANSLCLTLNEDAGNRSDFVGRIYGMLQKWDFNGELYFVLGNNYDRIDEVIRLIESEKPELSNRVRFFLDY